VQPCPHQGDPDDASTHAEESAEGAHCGADDGSLRPSGRRSGVPACTGATDELDRLADRDRGERDREEHAEAAAVDDQAQCHAAADGGERRGCDAAGGRPVDAARTAVPAVGGEGDRGVRDHHRGLQEVLWWIQDERCERDDADGTPDAKQPADHAAEQAEREVRKGMQGFHAPDTNVMRDARCASGISAGFGARFRGDATMRACT
jgi:hypothetical protein